VAADFLLVAAADGSWLGLSHWPGRGARLDDVDRRARPPGRTAARLWWRCRTASISSCSTRAVRGRGARLDGHRLPARRSPGAGAGRDHPRRREHRRRRTPVEQQPGRRPRAGRWPGPSRPAPSRRLDGSRDDALLESPLFPRHGDRRRWCIADPADRLDADPDADRSSCTRA
jgi:hypothetical protein